jgi:ribosomal protein L15
MDTKILLSQYQNGCARLGDLEMQLQVMDENHEINRKALVDNIDNTKKVLKSLRVTIEMQNAAAKAADQAAKAAEAAKE